MVRAVVWLALVFAATTLWSIASGLRSRGSGSGSARLRTCVRVDSPMRLSASSSSPPEQKEGLEKRISELKEQLASVRESKAQEEAQLVALDKEFGGEIARIKKEFARMKERAWEEATEIDNKAKTDALKEVLPITDNYPRAKSLFVPTQTDREVAILEAYDQVFKSFSAVIEGFGVKRVESIGQPFDYNMMEAIMTAPSVEYAKDIVCTEYQIGYRIGDKCVRPAMVVVSTGPGPATA